MRNMGSRKLEGVGNLESTFKRQPVISVTAESQEKICSIKWWD